VLDVSVNAWHERAGFSNGEFVRHRSNCHVAYNNVPHVGDYANGKIYVFDLSVYTDDGQPQKWLRSWRALPTGQNNLKRTVQHSLQIDMESGIGLVSGQGVNPQVMMRFSDDGGHTWSNEKWAEAGRLGEYQRRVFFRRLGMTTKLRDRVYELSGTDPNKTVVMGAELILNGTNA
jgi:hypothetical protein